MAAIPSFREIARKKVFFSHLSTKALFVAPVTPPRA
jgi:hypothetical protein